MTWSAKTVDTSGVTISDIRKELGREWGLRSNVYPKWIEAGKMPPDIATAQLAPLTVAGMIFKSFDEGGIQTPAQLLQMVKIHTRIQEVGGPQRVGHALKVLEMLEAGADLSAVHEIIKAFPGAKVSGVTDKPALKDLGPGDLAEAA